MSELNPSDRKRHVYLSGMTQHGKSTLMHAMVYQDMRAGHGLCVIDGKGSDRNPLAYSLLDWVPEKRKDDVIYLDIDNPIPLDFMACKDPQEAERLASDIGQLFNRLDKNIGGRMDSILQWIVTTLTLMESPTFLDIYTVLTDLSVRDKIRKHPKIKNHPKLGSFWKDPNRGEKFMKGESAVALALTQMTKFVLSEPLNIILDTRNAPLKIEDAIRDQKIIIVRLNADHQASMVYGSLLISKIQQAIFRRKPGIKHPPFMLYVDEFQDFKPAAFQTTLSQGGGLGLCLTIANQYFNQLDTDLQDAIVNNISTYFLFNMSQKNAANLADRIKGPFPPPAPDPRILRNLREDLHELKKEETAIHRDIKQYGEWQSEAYEEHDYEIETSDGRPPFSEAFDRAYDLLNQNEHEQAKLKKQIDELEKPIPKPLTYLDMLPNLPVGQAIYRGADGIVCRIKTPAPPPPLRAVGKTSHAQHIKDHTLAEYGLNRISQSSTGQTPEISHDEVDAIDYDTIEGEK